MSSFDESFPLPYRVTFQVILAVWGWTLNVYGLSKFAHINTSQVIKFHHPVGLSNSLFTLSVAMSIVFIFSLCLFWLQTSPPTPTPDLAHYDFLPWLTFFSMLGILLYPGTTKVIAGRSRFLSVLKRILLGGIDRENRLQDILVADALTSYSRVFADLVVMFTMLFKGKSSIIEPDRSSAPTVLLLIFTLLPFLIRLNQCFIEWKNTGSTPHVLNLFKYATAFPMAFARLWATDDNFGGLSMWVFAAFINSTYSYIWDIRCDWDLNFFSLRPTRYFSSNLIYYCAIVLDLVLRFTWCLKLSTNWSFITDTEQGMFYLAIIEIFRRWGWVFFRIESDWAANIQYYKHSSDDSADTPLPLVEHGEKMS